MDAEHICFPTSPADLYQYVMLLTLGPSHIQSKAAAFPVSVESVGSSLFRVNRFYVFQYATQVVSVTSSMDLFETFKVVETNEFTIIRHVYRVYNMKEKRPNACRL